MTTLRIRYQIPDRAHDARLIIYLISVTPADARSVRIMPLDDDECAELGAHHFSRFLSTQKIGA